MDDELTVITTLDLKAYRFLSLLIRVYRLGLFCRNRGLTLIVVCAYRNLFIKTLLRFTLPLLGLGKRLILVKFKSNDVNNSKLRNAGIRRAKTNLLMFCDIDLIISDELINVGVEYALRDKYATFPCIYLNKIGSVKIRKRQLKFPLTKSLYQHVAIPSSVIFMEKTIAMKVGGFDEGYQGHGYEDFDFMIRVLLELKRLTLSTLDLYDEAYYRPILSKGFRAALIVDYINHLCPGHENIVAFHLYHKKNRHSYESERKRNRMRFSSKFLNKENRKEFGKRPLRQMVNLDIVYRNQILMY